MRIISGRFRRRVLTSPEGDGIRPTTDRTRESMFNIIVSRMDLEGAHVVDLYCGSGSLGIEAWSRGAKMIHFVDRDPDSLSLARKNAYSLEEHAPCRFVKDRATNWLDAQPDASFDLVLADPPYDAPDLAELIERTIRVVKPDGLFVLEHDHTVRIEERPELLFTRKVGKTALSVFMKESVQEPEEGHDPAQEPSQADPTLSPE